MQNEISDATAAMSWFLKCMESSKLCSFSWHLWPCFLAGCLKAPKITKWLQGEVLSSEVGLFLQRLCLYIHLFLAANSMIQTCAADRTRDRNVKKCPFSPTKLWHWIQKAFIILDSVTYCDDSWVINAEENVCDSVWVCKRKLWKFSSII